jgi:hypothetical protein
MFEAKAFITFIRVYSALKSERLSAKTKLTPHTALIRSVMTYACPLRKLSIDTYLLKTIKGTRTIGKVPRCTPVSDMHTAFNLPYVYDYITKCADNKQKSCKRYVWL